MTALIKPLAGALMSFLPWAALAEPFSFQTVID